MASESAEDRQAQVDATYHKWKLQKRTAHLPYDNEAWVVPLAAHTFRTRFLELPMATAEAMVAHYRHTFTGRAAITAAQMRALFELQDNIDAVIAEVNGSLDAEAGAGAFVRLSSRSPKDACVLDRAVYDAELETHQAVARRIDATGSAASGDGDGDGGSGAGAGAGAAATDGGGDNSVDMAADDDETPAMTNARMLAFSEASWRGLRVTTGVEAMAMLLSSERTYVDLLEALEASEVYSMRIVVREWMAPLRQDLEFRGFCHKGVLTSVSGYNHYVHLPHVEPHTEGLRRLIVRYWQDELRDRLADYGLESYVVDFAVVPENGADTTTTIGAAAGDVLVGLDVAGRWLERARVLVVELNPFDKETGPGLFSWKTEGHILRWKPDGGDGDNGDGDGGGGSGGGGDGSGSGTGTGDGAARGVAVDGVSPLFEFRMHNAPVPRLREFVDYATSEGFAESEALRRRWPPTAAATSDAAAATAGAEPGRCCIQ